MALIRKEDVLDMLKNARSDMIYPSWYQVLRQRVDLLQTYDERKTSKWKRVHNHVWECTTDGCGMRVSIRTPYCAYCGAKMEVDNGRVD